MEYVYIEADEDFYDLEDMFEGKYIRAQNCWRIKKKYEKNVLEYLVVENEQDVNTRPKPKKIYRANSVNASPFGSPKTSPKTSPVVSDDEDEQDNESKNNQKLVYEQNMKKCRQKLLEKLHKLPKQ